MKRHFLADPDTGAVETFEYDEGEDKAYIHRVADVSPIIEDNKRRANDGTEGYNKERDMVLQARIPTDVIYLWLTRYGVNVFDKNHMPAVKRLLNSNEFRYLRVNHLII
jgi:hypothetical protein